MDKDAKPFVHLISVCRIILPIIADEFSLSVTFVKRYCTSVQRSDLQKPKVSRVEIKMHEFIAPVSARSGML